MNECDNSTAVAKALNIYLREIEVQRLLCEKHLLSAAIHRRGKELQVYRQFDRNEDATASIRRFGEMLPSWDTLADWERIKGVPLKVEREVIARMGKHSKQHPFFTRGVAWERRPVLIHGYKFEPDPVMKLELILPSVERHIDEFSLHVIGSALRCHEYLVPDFVATAKAPYDRHETKFLTLTEYLTQTMPKGLYATEAISFPNQK